MLQTLRIKNFALVTDLVVDFAPGFNVITGETGAGKSILIGALTLLLGERADRTMIRSGADSCAVEAVFAVKSIAAVVAAALAEHGLEPCDEGQLLLKRTLSPSGQHRQFVNGSPATRQALEHLGALLVDIHGPHDHQTLLHAAAQLRLLDSFADLAKPLARHAGLAAERSTVARDLTALSGDDGSLAARIDLLRHQAQEIERARIDPDAEPALEEAYRRAANAARLLELAQAAGRRLDEDEDAVLPATRQLGRIIADLHRIDPGAAELRALHEQAAESLAALRSALNAYAGRIDVDAESLAQLEQRITQLQDLKRKYGGSLHDVVQLGEKFRAELLELESRTGRAGDLLARRQELERELAASAKKLHAAREKAAAPFGRAVRQQLREVGFNHAEFEIQVSADTSAEAACTGTGGDRVELLFSPNRGEPVRPLRAIASSGEMARVMLALKNSFAALDDVPVLVFDEVDANIGGETAGRVGEKMRRLGQDRQVLCITHLATVAAQGDAHFRVAKLVRAGRTVTEVEPLRGEERTTEIARMLGGQTDAALRHAAELLRP